MEIVHSYKCFGTIFEDTLKWDLNTETTIKKGHQQLHQLRSFNIAPTILKLFCNSFIQNVLTFTSICWLYSLNSKQRSSLQRVVNYDCKIIGDQVRINRLYTKGRLFSRTLSMPCMESSNACLMGAGSDHWHTKPTQEELFVPTAVRLLNRT